LDNKNVVLDLLTSYKSTLFQRYNVWKPRFWSIRYNLRNDFIFGITKANESILG